MMLRIGIAFNQLEGLDFANIYIMPATKQLLQQEKNSVKAGKEWG